jgi:hypothetical protein
MGVEVPEEKSHLRKVSKKKGTMDVVPFDEISPGLKAEETNLSVSVNLQSDADRDARRCTEHQGDESASVLTERVTSFLI